MSRRTIFIALIASLLVASYGTFARAQDSGAQPATKHHHKKHHKYANPEQYPSGASGESVPNPSAPPNYDENAARMLREMQQSSEGTQVPQGPDPGGYIAGRPFFSRNPNDQPK